jgi:cytochrome c oxidase subunit 4
MLEHDIAHGHGHDHVVPLTTYFAVFIALLVGTALTVWVSYADLGMFNTPVAMVIAFTKAFLVATFFMHLKYNPKLLWLAVGSALFMLFHLIVGFLADYYSRGLVDKTGLL